MHLAAVVSKWSTIRSGGSHASQVAVPRTFTPAALPPCGKTDRSNSVWILISRKLPKIIQLGRLNRSPKYRILRPTRASGDYLSVEPITVKLLLAVVLPLLISAFTAVFAWLRARYGRVVRLKAGEIEIEARTVEQVKTLLNYAEEIHQRNQLRTIQ